MAPSYLEGGKKKLQISDDYVKKISALLKLDKLTFALCLWFQGFLSL